MLYGEVVEFEFEFEMSIKDSDELVTVSIDFQDNQNWEVTSAGYSDENGNDIDLNTKAVEIWFGYDAELRRKLYEQGWEKKNDT